MTPADISRLVPPPGRVYVTVPMCRTVEEAIDFLERHGAAHDVRLWRAEDGSIRGRGCAEIEVP